MVTFRRHHPRRRGLRELHPIGHRAAPRAGCCRTCRWRTATNARASRRHRSSMAACTCSLPNRWTPSSPTCNRARPTIFISVPRLWLKFQQGVFAKMPPKKLDRFSASRPRPIVARKVRKGLGLDQVMLAASGSAPIPADLITWYRRLGLNLYEGYGMTEDNSYSHTSTAQFNAPGYVGVRAGRRAGADQPGRRDAHQVAGPVQRLLQAAGAHGRSRSPRTGSSAPATSASGAPTGC